MLIKQTQRLTESRDLLIKRQVSKTFVCLFLWSCYQKLHNLLISLSGNKESKYFFKVTGACCVSVFICLLFGILLFFQFIHYQSTV